MTVRWSGPGSLTRFARNSNSKETTPCCNSVNGHQIASNFCTCHDITAFVPCTKFCSDHYIRTEVRVKRNFHRIWIAMEQGKSGGFESCDWPIVRKRPIWVKIGDVLYRVTLKFDGWPWKTIGHLSFAVSSCVQHFIAIGEFKLELQCGNAQFGSNSTIFRAVWPWNLTEDLEKQ